MRIQRFYLDAVFKFNFIFTFHFSWCNFIGSGISPSPFPLPPHRQLFSSILLQSCSPSVLVSSPSFYRKCFEIHPLFLMLHISHKQRGSEMPSACRDFWKGNCIKINFTFKFMFDMLFVKYLHNDLRMDLRVKAPDSCLNLSFDLDWLYCFLLQVKKLGENQRHHLSLQVRQSQSSPRSSFPVLGISSLLFLPHTCLYCLASFCGYWNELGKKGRKSGKRTLVWVHKRRQKEIFFFFTCFKDGYTTINETF